MEADHVKPRHEGGQDQCGQLSDALQGRQSQESREIRRRDMPVLPRQRATTAVAIAPPPNYPTLSSHILKNV